MLNSTESSEYQYSLASFSWTLHPVFLSIFLLSGIGSVLILGLVVLSKTFRRSSNYLIANLCVASVYHITITILYQHQAAGKLIFSYGPILCHILGAAYMLSVPVLPLTISAMSLERSRAATNPLDSPSPKSVLIKIAAIWIVSGTIVLPRGMNNAYDPSLPGTYKCTKTLLLNSNVAQIGYAILTLLVIYFIPTVTLLLEFASLRSQMKFLAASQVEQKKRFHRRLRLMQNACIFTLIFITCWLPLGIFQFPFDLPDIVVNGVFLEYIVGVRNFFRIVVILNVCLNPILLLLLSFDVREFFSSCTDV